MEYIREESDRVVTYDVTYNYDELERLRCEIIDRCGIREHKVFETANPPHRNPLLSEHYSRCEIEDVDIFYKDDIKIYHIEYDEIIEPKLSILIDGLLRRGDTSLIDAIYFDGIIYEDDIKTLEYKYSEKNELVNAADRLIHPNVYRGKIDYDRAIMLLNEAKKLENDISINKSLHLEDQNAYVGHVKKAISLIKLNDVAKEPVKVKNYNINKI